MEPIIPVSGARRPQCSWSGMIEADLCKVETVQVRGTFQGDE